MVLAPYGLAGTLTGQSYKDTDLTTQKVVADWQEFYVVQDQEAHDNPARCTKVVEVIVGKSDGEQRCEIALVSTGYGTGPGGSQQPCYVYHCS